MSHRDFEVGPRLNADLLKAALHWLLRGVDWSPITWRTDCTWTPRLFAAVALLWAWSDELTLGDRFRTARKIALHLDPRQEEVAGSYQAFIKLLARWTAKFVAALQEALRRRMQEQCSDCWLILGFALFGGDGSRDDLPRTRSHELAYSAARHPRKRHKTRRHKNRSAQKKANSPQLWMTTLWHVASGLPWDWRIGPADSSERAHLLEMIAALPSEALLALDAGFVGYDCLQAILGSGRHVLLRVGANVRLLRKLGYVREAAGTVYLWPEQAVRRHQPPLILRLVESHTGKHPMYLLTSVSAGQLSDRQVVQLYARRWGIELFYRSLKQTFERRKLRSDSAEPARAELEWSFVGLWAMSLYALVQIRRDDVPPHRLSCAKVLRAFRRMLRDYLHPVERGHTLCDRLRRAVIDSYQRRNKTSRDYPRQKQETPPGKPHIKTATRAQIQAAQALRLAA